jgi:hypothetical protein
MRLACSGIKAFKQAQLWVLNLCTEVQAGLVPRNY